MPTTDAETPLPPVAPSPRPAVAEAVRDRVARLAGDAAALEARLAELDAEWDIERVLEANAVAVAALGSGLAFVRHRRLLPVGLPVTVAVFVLQHAVRGVRPPETLLRRLGFRSAAEIAGERAALMAVRGGPFTVPRRPGLAAAIARTGRRRLARSRSPGFGAAPPAT